MAFRGLTSDPKGVIIMKTEGDLDVSTVKVNSSKVTCYRKHHS